MFLIPNLSLQKQELDRPESSFQVRPQRSLLTGQPGVKGPFVTHATAQQPVLSQRVRLLEVTVVWEGAPASF